MLHLLNRGQTTFASNSSFLMCLGIFMKAGSLSQRIRKVSRGLLVGFYVHDYDLPRVPNCAKQLRVAVLDHPFRSWVEMDTQISVENLIVWQFVFPLKSLERLNQTHCHV